MLWEREQELRWRQCACRQKERQTKRRREAHCVQQDHTHTAGGRVSGSPYISCGLPREEPAGLHTRGTTVQLYTHTHTGTVLPAARSTRWLAPFVWLCQQYWAPMRTTEEALVCQGLRVAPTHRPPRPPPSSQGTTRVACSWDRLQSATAEVPSHGRPS